MNKIEQKIVLERFLDHHGIEMSPTARLCHYGRRFRWHFPAIADPIHPSGQWTRKPIERLAEYVATLDPSNFEKRQGKPPTHLSKKKKRKASNRVHAFLDSWEWRALRYQVISERGAVCECCGATKADARIEVDHIKPISKHWHLRLHKDNLQVLCRDCNMGKGNWDETDWRAPKD